MKMSQKNKNAGPAGQILTDLSGSGRPPVVMQVGSSSPVPVRHGTLQEGTILRSVQYEKKIWTFATWNIRTLLDSTDRPVRRSAIILQELQKYNIDIAALSETRMAEEGKLTEDMAGYTLYWKGVPSGHKRIHGVGLAVETKLI